MALEQVELNRLRDSTALASFAVRTEDELQRTKQGVVQLLSCGLPDGSTTYEFENPENPDEEKLMNTLTRTITVLVALSLLM